MIYSAIPLAQTVVEICKAKGIKHIVISPGSRNAPLTIGFSHDSFFKSYSIVDERCAAFFALGIAQQLKEPVAVVCTSGSALLNYYPAISEAFYSHIPLVVLSADRPEYMVGIGDGQTINQENVFANHILYTANLKQMAHNKYLDTPVSDENQDVLEKEQLKNNALEINKAINTAILKSGPVHINIPFDEPLYGMVEDSAVFSEIIQPELVNLTVDDHTIANCAEVWNESKRKLILVGVLGPNEVEQQIIDALVQDESVLIFTETTSNVNHEGVFSSIDKIIAPLDEAGFKALQPDVLLTFGGLIVSKKIKAFLRTYKPKHHWHIGLAPANNTFFCLDTEIKSTVNQFFSQFLPKVTAVNSDYKAYWNGIKNHRGVQHKSYLERIPFSDFKVFNLLLESVPNYSVLQLGNSSTIRYSQLFDVNPTLEVYCNRGTSGIDGSTSTAIGSAVANSRPTICISGDLSFFYDSNALWNNYIPESFRIVVINNEGGGIFRILPGHKNTDNFDYYFETKHQLSCKQLAEMYGFQYQSASNEDQLRLELSQFYNASEEPKILEIFTPSTINDTILLDYFKAIK